MESIAKRADGVVLKELECPVCLEYMLPPIRLCENGHNICKICLPKLQNCPTCRGQFIPARNIALENLASSQLDLAQPFSDRVRCPFAAVSKVKCFWKGSLKDIKAHVLSGHESDYISSNETEPVTLKLEKFTSTKYYMKRNHYRKIISTLDELFYTICKIDGTVLYCAVLYIGPEDSTSKYKYRFTVLRDGGMEIISMISPVRNYMIKLDHIIDLGLCVKLDYKTAWNFLDSKNALSFEIEIFNANRSLQVFRRIGETSLSFREWITYYLRRGLCTRKYSLESLPESFRNFCCGTRNSNA